MSYKDLVFAPTSENALLAKQNGTLEKWVQNLLLSEDSYELAKTFAREKPVAVEILQFPLSQLKRIEGPEENEEHRQSPDVWEGEVNELAKKIKNGYKPAPLIVTDFWNYFEIADGNHRHEALLRVGIKSYWTIFFIKHEKGRKYLQDIMKPSAI